MNHNTTPSPRTAKHGLLAMLTLATSLHLAGCATLMPEGETQAEEGAVIGAASGAVIGGIIGNRSGSTAKGAILGAVVGGAAGALIGSRMDEQADDLESRLENAKVERVGEGIQVTFDSGLLFGFDSSDLLPASRDNLARLAASLQDYPDTDVVIIGHTDSRGTDSYNQSLSERRAQVAANHLVASGLSGARVRPLGLGETEPVASNETDAGRQENRRVEVAIFASEEYRKRMTGGEGF
ncbi:MAG: OmpA family protein [Gemmatimonadota bacterium]|nr:OmpA family protein [Gemmatimonadota bacterium]MDH5758451.1 OmpA family protein [Gemmatimonadota bacterium]